MASALGAADRFFRGPAARFGRGTGPAAARFGGCSVRQPWHPCMTLRRCPASAHRRQKRRSQRCFIVHGIYGPVSGNREGVRHDWLLHEIREGAGSGCPPPPAPRMVLDRHDPNRPAPQEAGGDQRVPETLPAPGGAPKLKSVSSRRTTRLTDMAMPEYFSFSLRAPSAPRARSRKLPPSSAA